MQRRRAVIAGLLLEAGLDHLVFCGANRFGSAVQWLTGWPVTAEAVGVFTPGRPDSMFVQHVNHVPLGAPPCRRRPRWRGAAVPASSAAVAVLERRAAKDGRVGVIGPMTFEQHAMLAAKFGNDRQSQPPLCETTSSEVGGRARLDANWRRDDRSRHDSRLRDALRPGLSERDLADIVERAYVALGGINVIHYFGVTAMADPQLGVPTQFVANRKVGRGDIVFAEISAAFWEHPGQVLRSFAVGDEPPKLYRELHAVADAAFDAVAKVLKAGAHAAAGD